MLQAGSSQAPRPGSSSFPAILLLLQPVLGTPSCFDYRPSTPLFRPSPYLPPRAFDYLLFRPSDPVHISSQLHAPPPTRPTPNWFRLCSSELVEHCARKQTFTGTA